MSQNGARRNVRFYDVLAQSVQQFSRFRGGPTSIFRAPKQNRRGALVSMTRKEENPNAFIEEELEALEDDSWKPNVRLRTEPIFVAPLQYTRKRAKIDFGLDMKFLTQSESIVSQLDMPGSSMLSSAPSFLGHAGNPMFLNSSRSSTGSAAGSPGVSAMTSPIYTERDPVDYYEPQPQQMFELGDMDDDGFRMPEIPPLATDLIQFLATIPDSAPASLSPFTFCEEVVSLQGQDFEQFLEEDTLCLKSVLIGNRFNDDTFFDFFSALSEEQFMSGLDIVSRQFFRLSQLSNLIRELYTTDSMAQLAMKIENACCTVFGCRYALVWLNMGSSKTLVNHSRQMKYPHGIGLVGTAAAEKRQVVAPNPTMSPIYCEEYDLPFCEDVELILVEPIVNPKTNHLYGVIMMVDKLHRNGASYLYWPQSELALLSFFSATVYRVFDRFDKEVKATARLYRVVAKFISSQLDFVRLLGTVKSTIGHMVKCETVSIYFIEKTTVYWFESKDGKVQRSVCSLAKAGVAGYVFEHNVFVHCACARDHPSFRDSMDGRYKSRAVLAIPLVSGNSVFSVIVCRAKKQLPCFMSEDVQTLSFVGAGALPALQMSLAYRKKLNELKVALRAQNRLAALLQAAESLSRETNIDTLVSTILMNACTLIGADRASLFAINESRTHLVSKVAHGTTKPLLLPIGQGISGHVAETGETINIPDVYEDPRFNASVDKATGYRTKSLMTIPVLDQQGNIVAVAQLMNKLNGESFTDSDVELTKAMSVFTGIALANSNVIEASLRSSQRVQALLETSILLMSGESLSSVLHHIMNVSRDLVHADRCALFMISSEKGKIQSTVAAGEENQIVVKRGKGVVGYVALHNTVVNIPDAYKDKRFHSGVDQATGYRTRSILASPVFDHKSKVIGVVEMINKDQVYNGGIFTEEDEKLTTAFSSFAGIAFDKKGKGRGGDGQTLAILLSNMMTADESNSYEPPAQLVFGSDRMQEYRSNRFDVSQVKTLDGFRLIMSFFFDLELSSTFQINNAKLVRFLLAVRELYSQSSAHSWNRAVESAQFVYFMLSSTELGDLLPKVEWFALMVAAICHDIDYDNVEDASHSEIALGVLYRNRPVMEMHHCEQTIRLISTAEHNIFAAVDSQIQSQIWEIIIALILSTDSAHHFEFLYKFRPLIHPQMMFNAKSPQHRLSLAQLVIKMSDVSAVTRLFPINEKWAEQMRQFEAKDAEANPVRDAHRQISFILVIARPMMKAIVEVLPKAKCALDQLNGNLDEWKLKTKQSD